MTSIQNIILEAADTTAAARFYADAFDLGSLVDLRHSEAPTSGFRGFTLSLVVSQPGNVDALVDAALAAGATSIKPAKKSFWGYGGSVQAPDGAIWTIASSKKKDSEPASRKVDDVVLLLGAEDVAASKEFYVAQGLEVSRSFGRKYVEFAAGSGPVKLALNGRAALAKNAGVPAEGTGSHRLVVGNDSASFTDPDGFAWETGTRGQA